jgi:hypothetical protein
MSNQSKSFCSSLAWSHQKRYVAFDAAMLLRFMVSPMQLISVKHVLIEPVMTGAP